MFPASGLQCIMIDSDVKKRTNGCGEDFCVSPRSRLGLFLGLNQNIWSFRFRGWREKITVILLASDRC